MAAAGLALLLPGVALAGDGTFSSPVAYPAGDFSQSVATGDFDSDGDDDLVVATNEGGNGGLKVYLGHGDGTFAPAVGYGASMVSVVVGDFNSDGDEDLAATTFFFSELTITFGNGDGTFDELHTSSDLLADPPTAIAGGDLDNDGDEDLAVANFISNNFTVHVSNGDGTFAAGVPYAAPGNPESIAFGDFDADGDEDLAVTNNTSTASVYPNNGGGTFAAPVPSAGGSGDGIAVGDFDNDGDVEPYVAGGHRGAVAVGDFNSDGDEDLAAADLGADEVAIHLGNGNGTFAAPVSYGAGDDPYAVAVGDFDSDGVEDLALANLESENLTVHLGKGAPQLGGNLLTNGGAEGPGAAGTQVGSPAAPGWIRGGSPFTFVRYSVPRFPRHSQAARWEGGLGVFSGGPGNAESSAHQTVSVAQGAASIDAGLATATLRADLGGYRALPDRMSATARYLGEGGGELGSFTIGPVTAAERKNVTQLLRRSDTRAVPAGTRSIDVVLHATNQTGTYNNGYGDNVKLTLDAPAPVPVGPAPPLSLELSAKKKQKAAKLAVTATCTNACDLSGAASGKAGKKFSSKPLSSNVPKDAPTKLRLRVKKPVLKRINGKKGAATIEASATDVFGQSATDAVSVKLKR